MNKVLADYEKLNAIREELSHLIDSSKDNPLKQLKNLGAESVLREEIDELKKTILITLREHFEFMPTDPKAVDFVSRFKAIDDKSTVLQASTRKMTASSGDASLNYLKGITELQKTRNELLEEMVGTLTGIQPAKNVTSKKKM